MPMMNPNAIGAAPAQGNPTPPQSPKLPPDQIAALRKDPDILAAVAKFLGRPAPLDQIPEPMLMQLAGAVHKLGVDGAVALMAKVIPPQLQARLKAPQGQPMSPQGVPR